MKKWLWRILVPLLLVVVLFVYRSLSPQRTDYFVLEPRDMLETLIAAGRIKFSQEVALALQVPGVVQKILFTEGNRVRKGDLLLVLDDSLERNRVDLARTELALAEGNFRKLIEYQRGIAWEDLRRAEINRQAAFERYQQARLLFQRGSIPEEELKDAQREWETALSLENTARLNFENIRENGPGFLEAEAQVERARLQLAQAEIDLQRRLLLAPMDGVIVSISKSPGEFVQAGETVVVLGRNPFQVVVKVDERQYKRIQLGMRALVSEQANPQGEVLNASVVEISPDIDTEQGTVEVTLGLDEKSPADMKPNAAVNAEIIVLEERGILAFPRRYLAHQNDQTVVWIERDGRAYPYPLAEPVFLNGWVKTSELPSGTILLYPKGLREGKRVVLGERSKD